MITFRTDLSQRTVHFNDAPPRQAWEDMGRPAYLDQNQVSQLQIASQLQTEPLAWREMQDGLALQLGMPPQSVAAVTITFSSAEPQP